LYFIEPLIYFYNRTQKARATQAFFQIYRVSTEMMENGAQSHWTPPFLEARRPDVGVKISDPDVQNSAIGSYRVVDLQWPLRAHAV
jgi:hypothetical protein